MLRNRLFCTAASIGLAALVGCAVASCSKGPGPRRVADAARVEAHTSGLVSRSGGIRVVLVNARGESGKALPASPLSFDPPIRGVARWEDERTIAFLPESPLKAGTLYSARFDFGLLDAAGDKEGAAAGDWFNFNFRTSDQRVAVSLEPLHVGRDGSVELSGLVSLSDDTSPVAVEKAIAASGPSESGGLRLSWSHESAQSHRFTVKGIARGAAAGDLCIKWNGSAVGGSGGGRLHVRLPAKGSFELLASRAAEGAVELSFSEPLERSQDLRGLVRVEGVDRGGGATGGAGGMEGLRSEVEGGSLRLYLPVWPASARVSVDPSLRSASGSSLGKTVSADVVFDWELPAVRYLSKGAILPTSQGLTLPVETMNVSGLVVEAVRIHGDNMLQFLQVNDLSSSEELRRVGEVVWRKTVDLGWKEDWKNRWVSQGLDLSPLVAANKDGMYQIRITFRKADVRYVCKEGHEFKDLSFPDEVFLDREESGLYDYVKDWPDGWDDYYKYKKDPCHPAFYIPSWDHDIGIRRNVLVSDIGAIARLETDGAWTVAASDLRSAQPMRGALVGLYSYQRILLASGTTGADGMVRLLPAKEASFIVLANGSQKNWLRVDAGSALAVSQFDVDGEHTGDGVKGFIYGERGVWRPGDDIHLTFILYDRNMAIPKGNPIHFELEDPHGRVVRSGTYTDSLGGFYAIETGTSPDAPTGPWLARVKVGGKAFSKSLRVETVMPNRLKIKLGWGASPWLSTDSSSMRLESTWLTGAKAGALKADVSLTFSPASTAFPAYKGWRFDDPTRSPPSGRIVLFDDSLEADGTADIPMDLSPEGQPPGLLKANILTRVFEPSGVFSSDAVQVDFHPYRQYVGVKVPEGDLYMGALPTDKQHRVDLALVDRDGKPVKSGRIEVSLYKLEWRWWWEKGEESLADVAKDLYARPIKREIVNVRDGSASWSFSVSYPNWGRYLVRASDAAPASQPSQSPQQAQVRHASGSIFYVDWPYGSGGGRGDDTAATTLSLKSDKEGYTVGERARVTFPSNEGGRALVAIERSGKLMKQEWVATSKDRTVYELSLTPDMAPNVYVHVSFVQPHLQTANDLPIRLYGVLPVMVQDPATRLSPVLDLPAQIAPNGDVAFAVREGQGKAMTCTVAVVDEGLLGITRYATPDPRDEFYRKEASLLGSFDLYQYVAGAWSGKLETLLAVGGSEAGLAGGQRKVSRFPPVVWFFPAFEVKAGETVRKTFPIGPYVGAVRFMVVAGSLPSDAGGSTGATKIVGAAGAAFGKTEVSVPVRSKLMAQLTAPRVLSPGEEATIPATVFSFLGKSRARVTLEVKGAASLVGAGEQFLDFAGDGDSLATFRIKAGDLPGPVHLSLKAEAGEARAGQDADLGVRSLAVAINAVQNLVVEAGKTWSGEISYPGAAGSNSASLEFSRLPTLNLGERLPWLIGYPHGCAEQTVSKAFPQLYVPAAVSLSADKLEELRTNVKAAIAKLPGYQTPRGGFTFWPGEAGEDEWLSVYATHFLVASRRSGYSVDNGLIDSALACLSKASRLWGSAYDWSKSVQAYRLYVLALAGKGELGSMNRLREQKPLPASAQYRLAAAYALCGQRDGANRLLGEAPQAIEAYGGLDDHTYGTLFRERASILEALNTMGDTARGLPIYRQLAEEISQNRWFSTQELSAALSAALPYAAAAAAQAGDIPELRVAMGERASVSLRLDRSQASLDLAPGDALKTRCAISNAGKTAVFVRVVSRGMPALPDEKRVANGLDVNVAYFDMNEAEVNPNSVEQGQDLVIDTTVRNLSGLALRNLALTQALPSGWEIVSFRPGEALPRPDDEGGDQELVPPQPPLYQYRDQRDDRVLTYFSLDARETKTFRTYVNKTYEGRFYLPAVSVEAMYDGRFQAIEPGRWMSDAAKATTVEDTRRLRNAKP